MYLSCHPLHIHSSWLSLIPQFFSFMFRYQIISCLFFYVPFLLRTRPKLECFISTGTLTFYHLSHLFFLQLQPPTSIEVRKMNFSLPNTRVLGVDANNKACELSAKSELSLYFLLYFTFDFGS